AYSELSFTQVGCVLKGSLTSLNHFEVRINQNRVEVWGGDPGSSVVRLLAFADNANLTMTRGVIWLEDVHYNACKLDDQCNHTFAWDNVAFDGPKPYRDLTFDVQDALTPMGDGSVGLGYQVGSSPVSFQVNGVFQAQQPSKALVMFNWFPYDQVVPSVSVNGGPWHDTAWPFDPNTWSWRTIAVQVPLSEVHSGTNTVALRYNGEAGQTAIANINLALIAAAPAP
ncbi:MAG: hypothetical protein ABIQ39_12335, partial [Ilumatobacteraceae bacterium]